MIAALSDPFVWIATACFGCALIGAIAGAAIADWLHSMDDPTSLRPQPRALREPRPCVRPYGRPPRPYDWATDPGSRL